jgi:hypothetical protein
MNVFELRNNLVDDYSSFVQGFVNIRCPNIRKAVDDELANGLLWPDPLIQLSPCFKPGESIDELVDANVLHAECKRIFRVKEHREDLGNKLRLHHHQTQAVKTARTGADYVLTTGTGSGKSLAYIIPIVDHVLRSGSGQGLKAIIVYPMNALANSQEGELTKFIQFGYPERSAPLTFRRYTGQESEAEKQEIRQAPPDILLTNYVMLELILTRPEEAPLVKACKDLKFLVLDELHTYRGRQGADVAMLVRRTREATRAANLQCVGTSATLAGGGTWEEQAAGVANVATLLFGNPVSPENVIGETLERVTTDYDFSDVDVAERLHERAVAEPLVPPEDYGAFREDILTSWVESTFGLRAEPSSGRLVRQEPTSITGPEGAARRLGEVAGISEEKAISAIEAVLLAGYNCRLPRTGFPVFAFRLHQFISRGDTVYASPEPAQSRYVTVQRQQYVPNEGRKRILLPLAFCRHCGHDFYSVTRLLDCDLGVHRYQPRDLNDRLQDDDGEAGFLYVSSEKPWPDDDGAVPDCLPDDWKDADGKVLPNRRDHIPQRVAVTPIGHEDTAGEQMAFLEAPFRFCPCCGVSYAFNQRSDFGKLSALGTEGRSTATTILSLGAVRRVRKMELPPKARKLLSFTDNRQDASLQAGHFNDFVEVGLMRSALYAALIQRGSAGAQHSELSQLVFDALGLPYEDYASSPEAQKGMARIETERALRSVLGYHLYRDLKRGWRITAPNLEQTGLLEIDYQSLPELSADEEEWAGAHVALKNAAPAARVSICRALLDWMRRELAIKVDYLSQAEQERMLQQSRQRLRPPWGFDESEQPKNLIHSAVLYPRSRRRSGDYGGDVFLSERSGFAQYLRRQTTFPDLYEKLGMEDTRQLIQDLMRVLTAYGIIEKVREPSDAEDVPGYQLVADAMVWRAGDGTQGYYDPIRQPTESDEGQPINEFFREYYRVVAVTTYGLHAHEHTAQVTYIEREKRETAFKTVDEGADMPQLPVLYCSPTMELGIDISQLNVVNMRNVPPTPANYAQRSGRAGRSGQPALVFTYCSSGSPHDQYFFKRPDRMVAGAVSPPQIDLANEDLIRSHVHAVWLSEARLKLGVTLSEVLDISGDTPSLALLPSIRSALDDFAIRQRAVRRAERILESISQQLADAPWHTVDWLAEVMTHLPHAFEQSCERWRGLYRSALNQLDTQHAVIRDASRPAKDKDQAQNLYREAKSRLQLLTSSEGVIQSDFYSYRYFASEGFLPGYNFPRLPLSAYIPGRRIKGGRDEYLSRPRFLAISEFGPRAFIYHEGSRYIIHRVDLPPRENEKDLVTSSAKICPECGYLHTSETPGYLEQCNNCEHCNAELETALTNLFRLQNVMAKRRDQINCDEEERLRLGFDIKTAVRYAARGGQLSCRTAEVSDASGNSFCRLSYGDAATIWRLNQGFRKRSGEPPDGFVLDIERGFWGSRRDEEKDDEDPLSPSTMRVMPFVSDSKNCLLVEPVAAFSEKERDTVMASLEAALKNAIQTRFELEDRELAAEPLPNRFDRRAILIYEASEGGAGVLRQLMDQHRFREVIRAALDNCHFDPETGVDRRRAPMSREDCEAACYDCLMSYTNQMDHELLDRKRIAPLLLPLRDAVVRSSASQVPRAEHLKRLKGVAGSDLERRWLDLLESGNYALPTHAQELIPDCRTRPDFLYRDRYVAVYIDGPPHDFPERQQRDTDQTEALEDSGWTVLRFHHQDSWQAIIDGNPGLFGGGK